MRIFWYIIKNHPKASQPSLNNYGDRSMCLSDSRYSPGPLHSYSRRVAFVSYLPFGQSRPQDHRLQRNRRSPYSSFQKVSRLPLESSSSVLLLVSVSAGFHRAYLFYPSFFFFFNFLLKFPSFHFFSFYEDHKLKVNLIWISYLVILTYPLRMKDKRIPRGVFNRFKSTRRLRNTGKRDHRKSLGNRILSVSIISSNIKSTTPAMFL